MNGGGRVFTKESILGYVLSRKGWKFVRDYTQEGNAPFFPQWAIGLRFIYRNGRGISVIAGEHFYCSPRKFAEKFDAVEIALVSGNGGGVCYGNSRSRFFKNDVEAYADWERFERIVKYVERMEAVK